MFQKLVNHNEDIQRLINKGYAIAFDSNCLIIRDIPYLDNNLTLQYGAIVSKFISADGQNIIQEDHQIYFAGSSPYGLDGNPIPNLGDRPHTLHLSDSCKDIVVQRAFSNKPRGAGKFADFFEKVESYVGIISGPATNRYPKTNYLTFKVINDDCPEKIFKFLDTSTSLAEITDLSKKFNEDIIAIIGLGGTGSYVLDFLVNTPVKEIRAFDPDTFKIHNAYRSPGKTSRKDFNKTKAQVYQSRYSNFKHGLHCKTKLVDTSCAEDFEGVTFAFVCVDRASSRKAIFDLLQSKDIPFIDVGMGLNRKNGPIGGLIRSTYFPKENSKEVLNKSFVNLVDGQDDIYKTNIQIGELNALNACLAVILFKQQRGFYHHSSSYNNLLFDILDMKTVGEEIK